MALAKEADDRLAAGTWQFGWRPLRLDWRALWQRVTADINEPYADAMGYGRIDRLTGQVLWWHWAGLIVLVWLNAVFHISRYLLSPFGWRVISPAEGLWALGIGLVTAAVPALTYQYLRNHFHWRLLVALSLSVFGYLFVFVCGGSIEMYFHIFVAMAYLAIYADWRLGWAVSGLSALHLLIFDAVRPYWVFHYGHNSLAPLVHVIWVVVAAIFTSLLAAYHRRAIVALEHARKRNDEFLSVATHELKTPLTSLQLYSQTIERSARRSGQEKLADDAAKLKHQIVRMTRLINNMLDISRVRQSNLVLNCSRFDIDGLVSEVVDGQQESTERHTIRVEGSVQGRELAADRERTGQVLANLLSNAIKYSTDGTAITVAIRPAADYLEIDVSDQGIGLDADEQKRIFHKFYRTDDAVNLGQPGFGLGLHISKAIIERHGGSIKVTSRAGHGSTFTVRLPWEGGKS